MTGVSYAYGDWLACPSCGGECLHHGKVTVYNRREDAERTMVTAVDGGAVVREMPRSNKSGNPSARRDGVVIAFSCESCPTGLELVISQHKGNTSLHWITKDPE